MAEDQQVLKGPLSLVQWRLCQHCKEPMEAGTPVCLVEEDDTPDFYVPWTCVTNFVNGVGGVSWVKEYQVAGLQSAVQFMAVQAIVGGLRPEKKTEFDRCLAVMRTAITMHGEMGLLALAYLGAEAACADEPTPAPEPHGLGALPDPPAGV